MVDVTKLMLELLTCSGKCAILIYIVLLRYLVTCIITPRACTRGEVIGSVVVVVVVVISTIIAKSQIIGVCQSALCHQTVESYEKLSSVCFKSLRTAHEHYKLYVFTGHTYRPHLPIDQCHVLFPLISNR